MTCSVVLDERQGCDHIFKYTKNLSKLTDHGTDFKWSNWGSGQFRELKYHYNGIEWVFVWDLSNPGLTLSRI